MTAAPACPSCATPVPAGAFACPACMLALRAERGALVPVYPPIKPSPPIYHVDLRVPGALPMSLDPQAVERSGTLRFSPTPHGMRVDCVAGKSFEWKMPFMRLRDACIGAGIPAAGGSARVTLFARSSELGSYRKYYGLMLDVQDRQVACARYLTGGLGQRSQFTLITPWTRHAALDRIGHESSLELRVQGPVLEGWLDGQRIAVTHDPYLGMGHVGVRIDAQRSGPGFAVLGAIWIAGVVA